MSTASLMHEFVWTRPQLVAQIRFVEEGRGEIPPIRRAALAAQGKKVRVALVGRDGETITQLLERLNSALGKAMAEDAVVDEVLPEIKWRGNG